MSDKVNLEPAISDIKATRYAYATNEPINRREGNVDQADLEKEHINSIDTSLNILKENVAVQNKIRVNQSAPAPAPRPQSSSRPAKGFGAFIKRKR